LIVLSAALLGLETSPSIRAEYGDLLHSVERGIVWAFAVELALRIGAHGGRWPRFFASGWNLFDFIVVVLCFVPAVGGLSAIARLARVLRALRVVSFLPNLQVLVEALLRSFASIGYVALLLSLVFYIYGIIGVGLFSVNDPEHFGSLGTAMLTLFQILTLEGWVDVMKLQSSSFPLGAPLYFISFILLGTMIVLNLFIGVIVNGMSEAKATLVDVRTRTAAEAPRSDSVPGSEVVDLARHGLVSSK
jgi:voltage-gated sodium channel